MVSGSPGSPLEPSRKEPVEGNEPVEGSEDNTQLRWVSIA